MCKLIWNSVWRRWVPMFGLLGSGLAGIGAFYQVLMLALFGSFMAAFSAVLSAVRQAEFRDRMEEVNKKLLDTQEDLIAANQKLLLNSEEHTNLITGGDSYADFHYHKGSETHGAICHKGKYPLYELSARFVDLDNPGSSIMSNIGTFRSIGALHQKAAYIIEIPNYLSGKSSVRLNIFFSARNGFWSEELRGKKTANSWVFSSRVRRTDIGNNNDVLSEFVDPEYPHGQYGKVDW